MKCAACGYDDECHNSSYTPFIEVSFSERAPFFAGIPKDWPLGSTDAPAVKRGTPIRTYACPECGTVKVAL